MGEKAVRQYDPRCLVINFFSGMGAQERTAGAPVSRRVARKTQKRYIQHQITNETGSEYWPRLFPVDLLKHLLIFQDSHNCFENCVSFWTGKIEQTAIQTGGAADARKRGVEPSLSGPCERVHHLMHHRASFDAIWRYNRH